MCSCASSRLVPFCSWLGLLIAARLVQVVRGKGQFLCGAKGCDCKKGLCSYEVNFSYQEAGEKKQALVKLRVCPSCGYKLNYKKERQFQKAQAYLSKAAKRAGINLEQDAAEAERRKKHKPDDLLHGRSQELTEGETNDDIALPTESRHVRGASTSLNPAQEAADAASASHQQQVLPADDSVWEQPAVCQVEASIEDEIDDYFEGMFL